jgi:Tfp pilus assembly protein PilV
MKKLTLIPKATFLAITYMACISCSSYAERGTEHMQQYSSLAAQLPAVASPALGALPPGAKKKIKIALLLDTSNSMDGLINQAKSQLWKMVNELSAAKCDNEKPDLEIALYEYGNDGLPSSEGYIRQVAMFTNDLDLISEKLFSLSTNGGSEFCGYVINTSLTQLDWQGDDGDLRIIFIAGNEPFTQGPKSATGACSFAKEKDVIINTIYCGNFEEGLKTGWKNGSVIASGEYMSIEQDRQTVYVESPYDREIAALNSQINNTYISYGAKGYSKKANQVAQDKNAESYGSVNSSERAVSKTSSFYSNAEWDIVDASKKVNFDITKIKEEDLPTELKGKSKEEKEQYVATKKAERETIKHKIVELNKQRVKYVAEKEKTTGETKSLDAAMLKAIKEQASKKRFLFES